MQSSLVDRLVKYAGEKVGAVGDPMQLATEFGPLISSRYLDRALEYVEIGKQEGAKLIAGCQKLQREGLSTGYFMEPTIFLDVDDDSRLAQEEVFGPVLAVLRPFDTLEEAVQRANNSKFGLAVGVQTNDPEKIAYVVRHCDTGTLYAGKTYNIFAAEVPFAGRKASGFGHGLGRAGFNEFTQLKTVWVHGDDKRVLEHIKKQ